MLAPSPFRASHRRSRSHSSLTSPSASPVLPKPDRDDSRAACHQVSRQSPAAAFPVASVFTSQPPEKWDVEAWRRGKRARRDPAALAEDTDMDLADDPLSSSPILDLPLHISAPSTPRLPTSSDAFHFFPTKPMASAVASLPSAMTMTHTATLQPAALGRMHADAFGDLRSAVSEAGEGFVRRMREFEASRSIRGLRIPPSSPSSSVLSHPGGPVDRRSPPMRTRGRKRPSPTSPRCPSSSDVLSSRHPHRYGPDYEDEDESDVEIRSNCASAFDEVTSWSPSKKRAVSLSALSAKASTSATSLPYPVPLRSRDRSSSPLGSAYSSSSSDDDGGERLSRRFSNRRNSRIRYRRAPRFVASTLTTSHAPHPSLPFQKHSTSPPPLSFSFSNSNSNNSSRMSLPIGSSPVSPGGRLGFYSNDGLDCETPGRTMQPPTIGCGSSKSSKKTERAVAALSLALANGAGSVSDYEALREAKDVLSLDHSETGSMWD